MRRADEPRCGRARLIRVCQLWGKLVEHGLAEASLREFLLLFYGAQSRKDLTPEQAESFIADLSEALNCRIASERRTRKLRQF